MVLVLKKTTEYLSTFFEYHLPSLKRVNSFLELVCFFEFYLFTSEALLFFLFLIINSLDKLILIISHRIFLILYLCSRDVSRG